MLNIVLYEPEIPPNTGNIMRLCANTGCTLHLVKPLGFELDDKLLRRAGLDYRDYADVREWDSLGTLLNDFDHERVFALTTKGTNNHTEVEFGAGDILMFGPETRGLPDQALGLISANRRLRIPMLRNSRSLNLSNAVSIVVYEAWRQLGFQSGG
jgi:tRNA (cytidine/uridine-2'-O-)-methyltransferase